MNTWLLAAQQLDRIQFAWHPDGIPAILKITTNLRRGWFDYARYHYQHAHITDPQLRRTLESIFGCQVHSLTNCQQCGLQSADNLLELRRRQHLGA